MTRRILLIGMMGVGKTTVGTRLAARLGWTFLDSDAQVLAASGRTVREIFTEVGDEALRQFESDALVAALRDRAPVVATVAGGAVLWESNRELLTRAGDVVWLRATIETLAQHVGRWVDRPHFHGDPLKELSALYETRQPFYASVATLVIDVDDLTPDEVVERILKERGAD